MSDTFESIAQATKPETLTTMNEEQKNLTEIAAEQRYPYVDGNHYFNTCQNSRRGDFCDGVVWYIGHTNDLTPRMVVALGKICDSFEPQDDDENLLFEEINNILSRCNDVKIELKVFDKPTYPITDKQ